MKTNTYYIASVLLKEARAFDGTVMTKDNAIGWLGESDDWPQVYDTKSWAKKFQYPDEIIKRYKEWDGMPWFCKMKPDTLKIYKITTTYTETQEEI